MSGTVANNGRPRVVIRQTRQECEVICGIRLAMPWRWRRLQNRWLASPAVKPRLRCERYLGKANANGRLTTPSRVDSVTSPATYGPL